MEENFKSGFVNIIGRPNAGKSTLLNALLGERMSIVTAKPQTTRHRIIAVLNDDHYQIVFSDTPGFIATPAYRMQEVMNKAVHATFEDADLVLLLLDPNEKYDATDPLISPLSTTEAPILLLINKVDTVTPERVAQLEQQWRKWIDVAAVHPISALHGSGLPALLADILDRLPTGPVYYPDDQLTDRTERFFVTEMIREKILEQYHQEIPYSVEVDIEFYHENEQTTAGEDLVHISALIYVSRKSQKPILIGKGGESIKRLGTAARQQIEAFLGKKVFLELHVKVRDNWRDDEQQLRRFGYQ